MSTAFDPLSIVPQNERERDLLERLKLSVPSARNFQGIDIKKVIWETYQFFDKASPQEMRDLLDEVRAKE